MHTKTAFLAAALFTALSLPLTASAATLHAGEIYTLPLGESTDGNLYVAGGTIVVAGKATGDLLAAGGNVLVSGTVESDALILGGNVSVTGAIGGDLRLAGGTVIVTGEIGGDLVVASGQVHLAKEAKVAGEIIAAGGQVLVEGTALGIRAASQSLVVQGTVAGDVQAIGDVIKVGSTARIQGDLGYSSKREAVIETGAIISGETNHTKLEHEVSSWSLRRILGVAFGAVTLYKLLALITLGLLLVLVFPKPSAQLVGRSLSGFGREALRGFAFGVLAPIAALVLFTTLVAIPLGIIIVLLYFISLILSGAYAGIMLGTWLRSVTARTEERKVTWLTGTVGIILFSFLGIVPILGWLAQLALILAALGSLAHMLYEGIWLRRA
jgi:cytoskeletal protein CcmA (bactofilin family)